MLSQMVEIEDVDYVPIFVTAEIAMESFYLRSDVLIAGAAGRREPARIRPASNFSQVLYLSQVL